MANNNRMQFMLRKSSCVAVGTFNIYIFRPPWVGAVEECPEGSEIRIQADLSRPGFQLSSECFGCVWTVRPDRIVLEAEDQLCDCGKTMAEVLRRLPETPLTAIGHNFEAASSLEPVFSESLDTLFPPQATSNGTIERQASVTTVAMGLQKYNLALVRAGKELIASVNVHTDVANATNEQAMEFASSFLQHRDKASELIEELWSIEVSR